MASAKHTPGDWYVIQDGLRKGGVASNLGAGLHSQLFERLSGATDYDAHLIAAAPDLLEVLEECLKRGWMWDNDSSLYTAACKVIRKAKGE